jgi:RNA polymerase sigma-70 factor (ECF subfamily)
LTADVFTKVWQKLTLYVDRGLPFEAWVFRIARNCLIDYLRRLPRFTPDSLGTDLQVADNGANGDYEQVLDRQVVEAALSHLRPEQRQVVERRFLEGRSVLESAALMGRSEAAVKKLQARALVNLRRVLLGARATGSKARPIGAAA